MFQGPVLTPGLVLDECFKRIAPTEEDKRVAQVWHTYVRDALKQDPLIVETRLQGSYRRSTAVKPIGDVDILVEMKWDESQGALALHKALWVIVARIPDLTRYYELCSQSRSLGLKPKPS